MASMPANPGAASVRPTANSIVPHGITYDPRRKLLLTADRGNKRLEYFTLNGLYHSTVEAPEITAPCNADVWGDYVLVPDLDGPLVILDKENKVISVHRSRQTARGARLPASARCHLAGQRRHRRLHLEPRPPRLLETSACRRELKAAGHGHNRESN